MIICAAVEASRVNVERASGWTVCKCRLTTSTAAHCCRYHISLLGGDSRTASCFRAADSSPCDATHVNQSPFPSMTPATAPALSPGSRRFLLRAVTPAKFTAEVLLDVKLRPSNSLPPAPSPTCCAAPPPPPAPRAPWATRWAPRGGTRAARQETAAPRTPWPRLQVVGVQQYERGERECGEVAGGIALAREGGDQHATNVLGYYVAPCWSAVASGTAGPFRTSSEVVLGRERSGITGVQVQSCGFSCHSFCSTRTRSGLGPGRAVACAPGTANPSVHDTWSCMYTMTVQAMRLPTLMAR